MGYLLKEALKTLCGVNQWAYAVFWKIGCQNPKLLIWEECYYEPVLSSNANHGISFHNYGGVVRPQDKVHTLVNKMMVDSHFNIVGEGLVGRVAFTGNHHWILSENYCPDEHPPEVIKEVCQQFAASMQTIAVIPALPHGVVQFGSFSTIVENLGFVKDVSSLVLELGYVSGALLSEDITANDYDTKLGVPVGLGNSSSPGSITLKPNTTSLDNFNAIGNSSQTCSMSAVEIQNGLQTSSMPFHTSNTTVSNTPPPVKLDFSAPHAIAKAEVIPSNLGTWMNQHAAAYTEPKFCFNARRPVPVTNSFYHQKDLTFGMKTGGHDSDTVDNLAASSFVSMDWNQCYEPGFVEDENKPESGNDLFDVLGADFKNKIFSRFSNGYSSNVSKSTKDYGSEMYCTSQGNSESGILSELGTDNLLDAVVTKVHPNTDENVSTLTSNDSASLPYGRFGLTDQMKGELFGLPKYPVKATGATSSCSLITMASKEESGTYSRGSSIYGSQISSWIQKDQKAKPSNTASTGYSKKPETTSKTTRRRLKPGENPRPRPKDRQMIQDRVKELREIVPNGAKCSIDSLLERTIKHMLFLQSVTKHAEKLKQTGESKIISKDGGFGGGATWAYEVGSQSMVCPIIVEDLNQPRQMLVEMLCEERGLFLEIADIIRGLGLTILKGVMETRDNKIWARFIVEANRDVTRMEIFMSLVRLLEPSSNTQENGVTNTNGNSMSIHQYHQGASSVPVVAGGSHGLQ